MENDIEKNKVRYSAYKYNSYLFIAIIFIALVWTLEVTNIIQENSFSFGIATVILVFSILLHVQNHKLKLKSVPSYLVYLANIVSGVSAVVIILANKAENLTELYVGIGLAVLVIVIQVVAAVFAFFAARELRKGNPNLIENWKTAKKEK